MSIEVIGGPVALPDGTPVPLSKAVRAGDFILMSGQLGFGTGGRIVEGGIAAQTRQCLENIRDGLAVAGAGLEDVARVTVWLTEKADFAAFNRVYAEVFPASPPARSTVCSELMLPEARVEIEVTAYKPKA